MFFEVIRSNVIIDIPFCKALYDSIMHCLCNSEISYQRRANLSNTKEIKIKPINSDDTAPFDQIFHEVLAQF